MPGFSVLYYLPEFAQTHVHWVGDVIHPTISSSAVPFSSCHLSFPASGSFPISQFFTSGGRSIGASASASVLPMDIQGWFPLGLTSSISLHSKGLSRAISSTTLRKHQFFGAQPFLWSNSHIHTWLLEKTIAVTIRTFSNGDQMSIWTTVSGYSNITLIFDLGKECMVRLLF